MEENEFLRVTEHNFWLFVRANNTDIQRKLPHDHLKISAKIGFYVNDIDDELYGYVERVLAHSSYYISKKHMETIEPKPEGKPNAVTYEQLLTLPWYWGSEDGRNYTHLLKPGYTDSNGNKNYFGTDKKGKRQISVNIDYVGHTYVRIEEDCGTRCVFNGHVRSFEELKLINDLVL